MPDDIDATIAKLHEAGATDDEITGILKEKFSTPGHAMGPPEPFNAAASREKLAQANAVPISEPTSFTGGFTKHLLTKEPATVAALATLPAVVGGPAGLVSAGASKAIMAGAPLASDLMQRGSKYIYGQKQDPVTAGEVASDLAGPALAYAGPALRVPIGKATTATGLALERAGQSEAARLGGGAGVAGSLMHGDWKTAIGAAAVPPVVSGTGKGLQIAGRLMSGVPNPSSQVDAIMNAATTPGAPAASAWDSQFLDSIGQQLQSGRVLSPAQKAAIGRLFGRIVP